MSQIKAEMILLEKATSMGKYQHYHLLSGQDLPIKPQSYIKNFFESHPDTEFVAFDSPTFNYSKRVIYRWYFHEYIGRQRGNPLKLIRNGMLCLQKMMNLTYNDSINFQKGANWFSITDSLARYVVDKSEWIKKVFKYSFCADEIFLQTLVWNSDFKSKLYNKQYDDSQEAYMRYIDWKRGAPYTFHISDLEELCASDMLFARKFDAAVDKDIVEAICNKFGRIDNH